MNIFKGIFAGAAVLSVATAALAQMTEEEITTFNDQSYFSGTPAIDGRTPIEDLIGDTEISDRGVNTMIPPTMSAETKMKTVQTLMAANPMGPPLSYLLKNVN